MKKFVLGGMLAFAAAAFLFIGGTAANAAGPGNSAAAQACQKGGYLSMVGADGTTFKNTGDCVSFAAHGGKFATSADGFIIPAGKVAHLTNAAWGPWNQGLCPYDVVSYGYNVNLGTPTIVASKPAGPTGCASPSLPDATVGPFATAVLMRVSLTDTGYPPANLSCNDTFYSTGGHALVTGSNPAQVAIRDSYFCTMDPSTQLLPTGPGLGNVNVTVTIS